MSLRDKVLQLEETLIELIERQNEVRDTAIVNLRSKGVWGDASYTLLELAEAIEKIRIGGVGSDGSHLLVATIESNITMTDVAMPFEGEPEPPEPDWILKSKIVTTTTTHSIPISDTYDDSRVDRIITGSTIKTIGKARPYEEEEEVPREILLRSDWKITDKLSANALEYTHGESRADRRQVGSTIETKHKSYAWTFKQDLPPDDIVSVSSEVSVESSNAKAIRAFDITPYDGSYVARIKTSGSTIIQSGKVTATLTLAE